MSPSGRARHSCLASNAAWRREARNLRTLSLRESISKESAELLRRAAKAADAQADWWLNAAIETR